MKWFLDISTQKKLLIGFALMTFLLVIVFVGAYRGITSMRASQKKIFEEDLQIRSDLKDLRFNQAQIRANSLTAFVQKNRERNVDLMHAADELTKENDELMRRLLERTKNPKYFARLQEFDTLRTAFRETRAKQVEPLIISGKLEEAKAVVTGIQAERNSSMEHIVDGLVQDAEKDATASVADSEKIAGIALGILIPIGAAALFLSLWAAFYLSRIIAGPLKEISGVAERIAVGDLTAHVMVTDRKDEVGMLAQTFVRMVDNLRQMNQEIRDGVNILASSASEILASTTEAATGMRQTTTSVSETTATVEEVKQTAQLSSEKSRSVAENAQKAALIAQQGNAAVSGTVEGMTHIRELMESVAESIVKLSEQTQAIGEIMISVSDLAQQSNLLAVNAAVEASKAGEHGKGFAVVAQEIKSLADQSKQATVQVRSILGDIQKATSAAVLAAEQVSKAVDGGVKQAAESGESIRKLTESIIESAQAATQIAASLQQQFAGMDQIAMAMESIKQAAQQNVSGSKQAEKAALNLNELGQKLKDIVSKYKV